MTRTDVSTALALVLVEIDGSGIEQGRTYKEKDTGLTKPLRGRQTGFLWQGGKYPVTISVDIPEGQGPYAPGNYVMAGAMFEAGKFGRLEFVGTRNMKLIPLDVAARAMVAIVQDESGEVIDFPEKKTGTGK